MESIRRRGRDWGERLLVLRDALGELYAAEGAALSRDLQRWGKGFARRAAAARCGADAGLLAAGSAGRVPGDAACHLAAGVGRDARHRRHPGRSSSAASAGWAGAASPSSADRWAACSGGWRDHLDWWQERVFEQPLEMSGSRGTEEAHAMPTEPEESEEDLRVAESRRLVEECFARLPHCRSRRSRCRAPDRRLGAAARGLGRRLRPRRARLPPPAPAAARLRGRLLLSDGS